MSEKNSTWVVISNPCTVEEKTHGEYPTYAEALDNCDLDSGEEVAKKLPDGSITWEF